MAKKVLSPARLDERKHRHILIALVRVSIGWVFFWAFIDKLFGLGFSTCKDAGVLCEKAWLMGGSPVAGFLAGATGPLADVFHWLGATPVITPIVAVLFMAGLLGIGVALILGAGMKLGSYGGATLLVLMFLAKPPTTNPFMDDHIVYALVLLLLCWIHAGHYYGLGRWWENHAFVKKYTWLN
jgi:thiosulfate dehydrogenase [quinone] large subunit